MVRQGESVPREVVDRVYDQYRGCIVAEAESFSSSIPVDEGINAGYAVLYTCLGKYGVDHPNLPSLIRASVHNRMLDLYRREECQTRSVVYSDQLETIAAASIFVTDDPAWHAVYSELIERIRARLSVDSLRLFDHLLSDAPAPVIPNSGTSGIGLPKYARAIGITGTTHYIRGLINEIKVAWEVCRA